MKRIASIIIAHIMLLCTLNIPFATHADEAWLDFQGTPSYISLTSIPPSGTMTVSLVEADESRTLLDNQDVEFVSSRPYVLEVDENGVMTAKAAGVSVVTAQYGGMCRRIAISVVSSDGGRVTHQSFDTGAGTTSDCAYLGSGSLQATKSTTDQYVMASSGDVAEMFFYDNMTTEAGAVVFKTNPDKTIYYEVGVLKAISTEYYSMKTDSGAAGKNFATEIKRSEGWHQVLIDLSIPGEQTAYLDGEVIFTDTQTIKNFHWMRTRYITAPDEMYYDAFSIYSVSGVPTAYDLTIEGEFAVGQELEANYKFYHPKGADEEGTAIQWQRADSADGVFEDISAATEKTYTVTEEDKFLRFVVIPAALGGSGNAVTSSAVTFPRAPEAKDVYVIGAVTPGAVLNGYYTYYDANGDAESDSLLEWYISDEENGEYKPISGENSSSYSVRNEDNGKYIKFAVTPKTEGSEPCAGEKVFSDVVSMPQGPEALNVMIIGEHTLGAELAGSYTYYDANNDKEENSILSWYRVDKSGTKTKIADGAKYKLTEEDVEASILFGVKAIASAEPKEGAEVFSEPFAGLVRPYAEDVSISGSVRRGERVIGTYKYRHDLGVPEGESIYAWYLDGVQIGSSIYLDITSHMAGKKLVFEVIPIAAAYPYNGEKVCSKDVVVSRSSGGGGISIGGSSSSGKSNSFLPVVPTAVPENTQHESTGLAPTDNANPARFKDIKGHWAYEDICWAIENGVAYGVSDTEFEPEGTLTRAQMAALLARIAELKPKAYDGSFDDIDNSHWAAEYITALKDEGIIDAESTFSPDVNISREDMVVMLMKTYTYITGNHMDDTAKQVIADRKELTARNEVYVDNAMALGIIKGMGDGYFCPQAYATRAQAMTVLRLMSDCIAGGVQ
ncbi:MAG: S-layer homology domain-containing protein [Clostridia bacterium]|nr:S-layer homology domain-containing protein [Clostridia bacterium]